VKISPTGAAAAPTAGPLFAITGSSGFVGRHLVAHLQQQGMRVRCLSRQAAIRGPQWPGNEHVQLPDYLDPRALVPALQDCGVLVHLAARAHVLDERAASPTQAFREANLDSAVAVAQAARAAGVARVVLVSSIGVNGNRTRGRAFTADDPPAPAEPYAVSKWQAEQAVAEALHGTRTSLVVLRPPLVYGADCPGNFRLLLRLVHRLPVVPLGGLRQPRSLIYVDNLCSAIVHAALHPAAAGRTFLLADGADLSVSEVVRCLARSIGKPSTRVWAVPEMALHFLARAAGKGPALDKLAAELAVDATAFTEATGWHAPITSAEALARTARDYMSRAGA
jgi:nucleoside-diphosphate-sugar epimerase